MANRRRYYRKKSWKPKTDRNSGSFDSKKNLLESDKIKLLLNDKRKKLSVLTSNIYSSGLKDKQQKILREKKLSYWLKENKPLFLKMNKKLLKIENEISEKGFFQGLFSNGQLENDRNKLSEKITFYKHKELEAEILRNSIIEIERTEEIRENIIAEIYILENRYKTQLANEEKEILEKQKRKEEREKTIAQREENKRRKQEEMKAKAAAYDKQVREQAEVVKRSITSQFRFSNLCPYCEEEFSQEKNKVHADHIHPVDKGGLSTKENMVYICQECNLTKSNLTLRLFCKKRSLDFEKVCGRLVRLGKHV